MIRSSLAIVSKYKIWFKKMQCSELEILNMLPKVLAYAITKKPSNCEFFLDL